MADGFRRGEEILQESLDRDNATRRILLNHQSQFNASIIADERYANNSLFIGFNKISDSPFRRIGIYVGSGDWKGLADNVQTKVKEILAEKGILF